MNKKLLTMALLALAFAACKKSDSSTPTSNSSNKQNIVGKWHYAADTVKIYTNGTLTNTYPTGGVTSAYYMQYNSDGTGLSGVDSQTNTTNFTYSISSNTLTVTNTGSSPENATIRLLTAHTMMLFFDDSSVSNGVTTRTTEAAYFSRQ